MTKQYSLSGVIPAMVTAAADDASDIDVARMKAHTKRLIGAGVHGLFPCASTGEAPLLTREQRQRVVDTVVEENAGRLPVMVGVGAMATRDSIQLARDAEQHGATHIVILPMHFYKVTEDELAAYFGAVSDSVSIPAILYNYPAITSSQNITPELAAELSHKHNIVGIKDSSGDMTQAQHYLARCTTDFSFFTGMDPLMLSVLQHGGAGVICASANVFPELLVRIYDLFTEGEPETALDLQRAVLRASAYWKLGTFPAAVKAGAALKGASVGPPFLPTHPLDATDTETLRLMLESLPRGWIDQTDDPEEI